MLCFDLTGIGSIFTKIGCESESLSDLLGSDEGVKNDNMMQYLGLIEQRTNQLLAAQAYTDSQVCDPAHFNYKYFSFMFAIFRILTWHMMLKTVPELC